MKSSQKKVHKHETATEKKWRVHDETLAEMVLTGEVDVTKNSVKPSAPRPRTMGECKQSKWRAIWNGHLDRLGCKRLVGIYFKRGPLLADKKRFGDWVLGFGVQKRGIIWLYGDQEQTRPGHVAWVPVTPEREPHILPPLEGKSEYIRHVDPLPRDIRWDVPYSEITRLILPSRVKDVSVLPSGPVLVTMTNGQQMMWSADGRQTAPPIAKWE